MHGKKGVIIELVKNIPFATTEFSQIKRAVLACVCVFLCAGAWGRTFRWVGTTSSDSYGDWNTYANWEGAGTQGSKITKWISTSTTDLLNLDLHEAYPDNGSSHTDTAYIDASSGDVYIEITKNTSVTKVYVLGSGTVHFKISEGVTFSIGTLTIGYNSSYNSTASGDTYTENSDEKIASAVSIEISGGGILNADTTTYTNTSSASTISITENSTYNTGALNMEASGNITVTGDGTGKYTSSYTNDAVIIDAENLASYTSSGGTVISSTHTYYWTGRAGDKLWTTSWNWAPNADGTGAVPEGDYPGHEDGETAVFNPSAQVEMQGFTVSDERYALTIRNNSTENRVSLFSTAESYVSPSVLTVYGYILFWGVGEINSLVVKENASAQISILTVKGNLSVESGATLNLQSTFSVKGETENEGNITGIRKDSGGNDQPVTFTKITNNGKIEAQDGTLTFKGDYSGSGSFTASSGNTFFYGDADFSALASADFIANNGSVLFISGGTQKLTACSGGQSFNSLSFSGDGGAVEISGTISASNLTLGSVNDENPLTVSGDGTIVVAASSATLSNLLVGDSIKIEETEGTLVLGAFTVTDGKPSAGETQSDYATVFKNGWNLGYEFVYTWLGGGTVHTAWSSDDNWDVGIAPGVSANNSIGAKVLIPDGCTYYPIVQSTFSVSSLTIGSSENSIHDARVTFMDNGKITLLNSDSSAGTLTNYGTIEYAGAERLTDGTSPLNDTEHDGTVEYSGSEALTVTDFSDSGSDYANLLITGTNVETGGELVVSGNLSVAIKDGANGSLQVKQNLDLGGNLSVAADCSFKVDAGKTFSFGGDSEQQIEIDSAATRAEFANLEIKSGSSVATASSFSVTGDFLNENAVGGFSARGGTVSFSGSTSKIAGNNTFYEFECAKAGATLSFEAGKTQTVTNSFTVTGASGSEISLTSAASSPSVSDTATWWNLDASGAAVSVENARVSYATSLTDIVSFVDVDEKNNAETVIFSTANWFERKYYWLGSVSSSWDDAGNWFFDENGAYPASSPNDGSDASSTTKKIIIATSGNNLVLENDVSVKSLTVNAGKTLDFAKFSVTADDSDNSTEDFSVGNGATLRFSGSGSELSANASVISGSTSFGSDVIFEYYGGGKVTAVSGENGADIPESQILKIVNAADGTFTHLLLGEQNIEVASTEANFNAGIIEVDGGGELSFSDSSLSMTSGLIFYSSGNGSLPEVGFFNLQVGGGTWEAAGSISCENFYFTGGTFSITGALSTRADFVAFGSAYDETDKDWHNSSNTRFAYPSGTDNFVMPSSPSAQFGTLSGSLTVGSNFYVNGSDMSSSSGFSLVLPAKTAVPALNTTDEAEGAMWGTPYAVAFNMTAANCNVSCADGTSSVFVTAASSTENFKHQNVTDGGGNSGWAFDSLEIVSAHSVSDSVIYVELNTELEKLAQSGSFSNSSHFSYNDGQNLFSGFYSDEACMQAVDFTSAEKGFFVKAADSWNGDADGNSVGSDDSTNLSGVHKSAKLDISLIEGFFYFKEGYTLSAEYSYDSSSNKAFTEVSDKVAPVLIGVYTGQEAHVTPSGSASASNFSSESQKPYDAHNFIEFRYSEPVSIGDLAFDEASDTNLYNIDAQAAFDSASSHGGALVANGAGGFSAVGFGTFSNGSISAGYKSGTAPHFTGTTDSARPHALYRKFSLTDGGAENFYPCRIRIAVAGKIDGTVTMNGASFYNWIGYIDSAVRPTGTFSVSENANIIDTNGNALNHETNASISVNAGSVSGLYGEWDVKPPVFATYVTNTDGSDLDLCWSTGDSSSRQYEIVGSIESNTSAYIERIEMHLFDNAQSYSDSDSYKWVTQHGWMSGSTISYSTPESEGGSRPFSASPKTKGGIRRSSLDGAYANFSYTYKLDLHTSESREFAAKDISQNAKSALFRLESASETSTENDGLYLALDLNPEDSNLPLRTTFVVTFTKENAFITDLAGNRLSQTDNGVTKRLGGLDITPPSFSMVISPIGENKVFAIFTKPLVLPSSLDLIKDNIEFVESSGGVDGTEVLSDLTVENVSVAINSHAYTALLFTLNRSITLSDVEKVWIRVNEEGESSTNEYGVTIVTSYIRDSFGNGIPAHTCHAISDFAVNAVDVIYAYSHELDGDGWDEQGIYGTTEGEGYAVHDFSADGGNYQKLRPGRDITFQIRFADYDNETKKLVAPSDYSLSFLYDKKSSLKSSWISDRFNLLTGLGWRLWIDKPMSSLASGYNESRAEVPLDFSGDDADSLLHALEFPHSSFDFVQNEEYQFFFKILDSDGGDIEIDHDGDDSTAPIPLYAFRMPEENIRRGDFSFVDLWSFTVSGITKQRGGVTILNNVINAALGEKTAIEVEMKESGNLNIFVMTLDGNIVKRLAKGTVSAGTHYYYWDGKNNAGKAVARGLYFVRVAGSGIDETRKVMVVK